MVHFKTSRFSKTLLEIFCGKFDFESFSIDFQNLWECGDLGLNIIAIIPEILQILIQDREKLSCKILLPFMKFQIL